MTKHPDLDKAKAPKTIYLIAGGEDESFVWCEDKVTDEDIEYIRKDYASSLYLKGIAEGEEKVLDKWESAIFYSEDTKSCLDRKVMQNHFKNALKELSTK